MTNDNFGAIIFDVLNAGMSNEWAAIKLTDDIMAALKVHRMDFQGTRDEYYAQGYRDGVNDTEDTSMYSAQDEGI